MQDRFVCNQFKYEKALTCLQIAQHRAWTSPHYHTHTRIYTHPKHKRAAEQPYGHPTYTCTQSYGAPDIYTHCLCQTCMELSSHRRALCARRENIALWFSYRPPSLGISAFQCYCCCGFLFLFRCGFFLNHFDFIFYFRIYEPKANVNGFASTQRGDATHTQSIANTHEILHWTQMR